MRMKRKSGSAATVLIALAAALAACSSQARTGAAARHAVAAPAVHPISGLPIIDLTVTHRHRQHRFRVEVASTGDEQAKGLMFRTAMDPDEGMIFPMHAGQSASFWMRNTVIPLDIIFIDLDGRISNIAANAKPYDETALPSVGVVSGVLELAGGRAAQLGIGPGDAVKW